MNEIYLILAFLIIVGSCYIQYVIAVRDKHFCYVMPLLYAILTFVFGFVSLLFAFALVFIAELTYSSKDASKDNT